MMNKLFAIVASLALTACLDESDPTTRDDNATDADRPAEPTDTQQAPSDDEIPPVGPTVGTASSESPQRSICERIVATEGPCAAVCDPAALVQFIPASTCVTFVCELDDGTELRTGGCNW